jgi:hypothetical protein
LSTDGSRKSPRSQQAAFEAVATFMGFRCLSESQGGRSRALLAQAPPACRSAAPRSIPLSTCCRLPGKTTAPLLGLHAPPRLSQPPCCRGIGLRQSRSDSRTASRAAGNRPPRQPSWTFLLFSVSAAFALHDEVAKPRQSPPNVSTSSASQPNGLL